MVFSPDDHIIARNDKKLGRFQADLGRNQADKKLGRFQAEVGRNQADLGRNLADGKVGRNLADLGRNLADGKLKDQNEEAKIPQKEKEQQEIFNG